MWKKKKKNNWNSQKLSWQNVKGRGIGWEQLKEKRSIHDLEELANL